MQNVSLPSSSEDTICAIATGVGGALFSPAIEALLAQAGTQSEKEGKRFASFSSVDSASDAYTIFAGYHLFFDGHFGVFPKSRNRYDHFPFFLTYSVVFEWIFMANRCILS